MKKILLSLLFSFLSLSALAESMTKNFEGLNLQIGVGSQVSRYQNKDVTSSGTSGYYTNKTSESDFTSAIGVGYTLGFKDKFTLGGIIEYYPDDNKSGNVDYYRNGVNLAPNDNHTKFKNQYNISLVPGFAINETTLIYGKLGFTHYNLDLIHTNGDPTDSYSIKGYSFGFGAKKIVSEHIYGFAEANYLDFDDKHWKSDATTFGNRTSSAYNGLVGIGYNF